MSPCKTLLLASLVLATLAGCGSSSTPADSTQAGTCSDGVKNGSETGVDCGGSCRAACAVASACTVNADCMLGTCSSGVCVVPPGAPPPTGPVDVVLGSAGGNVQVVTPEGVSLQVAVPPGALAGDVALKVEALPARNGEWFRIGFNAPGLLFRIPVTVTLTIPGGTFGADATLYAQAALPTPSGVYPRIFAPSTTSPDGRTLTATVTSLGNAGLAPVSLAPGATTRLTSPLTSSLVGPPLATPPGDDAAYWNSFFLHAAAIPLQDLLPALMLMLDGLAKEGLVTEAVALSSGVDALLMRLGEDQGQWSQEARFFFTEMAKAVCTGFTPAIERVDALAAEAARLARGEPPTTDPAPVPVCFWRIREAIKDLGILGTLENKVEAISHGSCGAASSWGAHVSVLADKIKIYMWKSSNLDRVALNACNCRDPKRLKAEADKRVKIRPWCVNAPPIPSLRSNAALTSGFDANTEPAEWEVLLGTVEDSLDAFAALYAVGDVAEGQLLDQSVGVNLVTSVRGRAYALCTENQDSSILSTQSKRVGALDAPRSDQAAPILLDAQRCGAALHLVAEHTGHTTSATLDVPFPTDAGQAPTVAPINVDQDGWLQISGPIATLRCRNDDPFGAFRLEDDELTFTSVANSRRSPLDSRIANGSQNVLEALALPFPVDIHTQLVALGLPTDKDASFDILVERKGPGCGVQPPSTTLFTVPVKVKGRGDRLILTYTPDTYTPGYFLKVFKIEPTGATELFSFTTMAGEIQNPTNSLYLRNQNRMVVHIGYGWGLVDPAGVVEMTYTSAPGFYEVPAAVGTGGKFRVHTYDQVICPPGGEAACDLIQKLRLYDNATNTLVDQFAVLANGHRYGGLAVGPAGEVLYFDRSNGFPPLTPDGWYLRPADGGPTRMLGTFPGKAAFSPSGDKAYFLVSYVTGDIDEVDLATGATLRLSSSLGSPVDFSIEPGGLIYWAWTSNTDRELFRLDLATGQETAIGPIGPELDIASLIP